MTALSVRTSSRSRRASVDRSFFRRLALSVLAGEGVVRAEIGILFADDALLHELNATYRRRDRPTDVLAFPLGEGSGRTGEEPLVGDVVISIDRAIEQARSYRAPLEEELTRLLVHGTLHLLGYDHHRADEARVMRAKEARYFLRKPSKRSGASRQRTAARLRTTSKPPEKARKARGR